MNEPVRETIQLIYSSTRPMPAHFTSNGERKQSFCIEFEPLTAEAEAHMASTAWGAVSDFLGTDKRENEQLSERQLHIVILCGENLMVGAFILYKLDGEMLMPGMKQKVIDNTIETFSSITEEAEKVLYGTQVNTYFDYCIAFGVREAKQTDVDG